MSTTDTNPQAEDSVDLLELFVQEDEEGTATAHVPLRWCVTPELIAACQRSGFKQPTLALAVRTQRTERYPGDHSEERWDQVSTQFIRLDREMTYVTFTRAGTYELRAMVVDLSDEDVAKTISRMGELFYQDGTPRLSSYDISFIEGAVTSESVVVPGDMFAKEPPAWLKRLVSVFFEKPARDQCQFRRRVLATSVFATLLLTLGMVVRVLIATAATALGFVRKFNWKGLLPFQDAAPVGKSSVWYTDQWGNADPARFPLWLLNPVTLTVPAAIVFGIMNITEHHGASQATYKLNTMGWWQAVAWVDGSLAAIVVFIGLVVGIVVLGSMLLSAVNHSESIIKRRRNARQRRLQREADATARIYRSLTEMTCTAASSDVRVSALPRGKKTVWLRYNEAKSMVCKPFAR